MPRAYAFTYSPLHPKSYVSRAPAAIESTVRVASTATATPDLPPEALIPAPLNPVQRLRRAATFWSQVVPILGNYALIQRKLAAAKEKGDPVSPEEEVKLWEDAHNWGAERLASTIQTLKGFYVKSGQVISTRVDMFPKAYTDRLMSLQDSVEPVPISVVKAVVRQDLLEGEPLENLFKEFDEVPLGSASIAQVHRAVLRDGREVAVKVQRPSEEPKLRGDIANLKAFSKRFRDSLPVDYYRVFLELERALTNELDFLAEAQAMEKIAAAVAHTPDGRPAVAPLVVPRAINGLVSKRVIVMDFIHGTPLTRLKDRMAERGIPEGSPEAAIFSRRLLSSLTEAFSRMVFGDGFLHGDPHPGNIFVMEGGGIALIDCGQVKQIGNSQKLRLADLVLKVSRYGKPDGPTAIELSKTVEGFGVEFKEGARPEIGAALALLLFGGTGTILPGGYSSMELSASSPLREIKSFPNDLVMLGRATVIIKGIASKVGVPWNLADRFAEGAQMALECGMDGCSVPIYSTIAPTRLGKEMPRTAGGTGISRRRFSEVRDAFRMVRQVAREWALGKAWESLPSPAKQFFIQREARRLQRLEAREQEEEDELRKLRGGLNEKSSPPLPPGPSVSENDVSSGDTEHENVILLPTEKVASSDH
ncbi:hypothetical protein NSK_000089 [Nannochloropsis salina CCMP1776]|uniref:Protein kinase domain-containing protein n=1 Tax=Nannochloropsis salina CCMP1776 TaxID=1027361 RepID=A0A4D9DFQ2_9STRA|nr:hypothetical protein NSK_000089 [Nannochloropsis salina CCMP1776]|eukprot:TFJ88515.1 hypothetical protein NSK_000089 [Nannochloropsis salina CCMP1776]